jgi:hypothetical protein
MEPAFQKRIAHRTPLAVVGRRRAPTPSLAQSPNAERTLGSGIQRAAFGGKQQYRDRTLASLRLPRVRECSSDETTSAWASGALLGTLVVGPRAAQPAVPVTFCP